MEAASITPLSEPVIQIALIIIRINVGKKSVSRYSQELMSFIYIGA
jgi:hypothetical protein